MTNMWGNNVGSSVTLQLSNDSAMGLVPAGTLSKLGTLYGAQQRTWALYEPALQFDFFEKHPKDVDGTMPFLRGYGTSFRMCNYDVNYPNSDKPTFTDINPNVFFDIPTGCPSTYIYNGVTYDTVSRHFAMFRKFKRRGRRFCENLDKNYDAKKKQGYIEYLGLDGNPSNYYGAGFKIYLGTSGEVGINRYLTEPHILFNNTIGKHMILIHGSYAHLGLPQHLRTHVSSLKVGICLVLFCKKEGQKPLFVYGPMIKGRFVVVKKDDGPDVNSPAEFWFKRD